MAIIHALIWACCLLLPAVVAAEVTVGGARFPEGMEVDGHPLVLHGYGVRETWWINMYAIGLYLAKRSSDIAYIKEDDVTKAIRVEVVYGGSVPQAVPENWQDELYPKLSEEATARFKAAYATLKHGDVVLITYAPGQGTHVRLNDQLLLSQSGPGLMSACLDLWIGVQPVSQELRRLLLNSAS